MLDLKSFDIQVKTAKGVIEKHRVKGRDESHAQYVLSTKVPWLNNYKVISVVETNK